MPLLLQLQKLPGKGDGGWKKIVSLRHFLADQKIASLWREKRRRKKRFGACYSTSNKLLFVASTF